VAVNTAFLLLYHDSDIFTIPFEMGVEDWLFTTKEAVEIGMEMASGGTEGAVLVLGAFGCYKSPNIEA